MGVWGLQCARVAWWFVVLQTELLAFGGSQQVFRRDPVQQRLRFSSCPAFLTLASLPLYLLCGGGRGVGLVLGVGGGFTIFFWEG